MGIRNSPSQTVLLDCDFQRNCNWDSMSIHTAPAYGKVPPVRRPTFIITMIPGQIASKSHNMIGESGQCHTIIHRITANSITWSGAAFLSLQNFLWFFMFCKRFYMTWVTLNIDEIPYRVPHDNVNWCIWRIHFLRKEPKKTKTKTQTEFTSLRSAKNLNAPFHGTWP